ncbi:hypothetical protein IR083_20970 [Dysgonomonas sp. GY75]|uniref:hypothetical protein n=1 Tax=Dysgonomonas sp. GY75 TaxID=2780419 RepID=UPI0018835116|nr:hypothetical protein [Dysgonomonas sp. GY75]MBF0651295.1 hypothetical protein [Dysgonomonas sp. GY75]
MLTITTDDKSVKFLDAIGVKVGFSKNKISYRIANGKVYFHVLNNVTAKYEQRFTDGIILNGVVLTPDNAEAELDDIFSLAGGGAGTDDHTQLTNRDAADQHPIGAITGLQNSLDALTTMQGNWLGEDFATYADLVAYDSGLTAKPADKTWTFVHADENPAGGNGAQACYAWLTPDGGTEPELSFRYKILVPTTETDPVFTTWKDNLYYGPAKVYYVDGGIASEAGATGDRLRPYKRFSTLLAAHGTETGVVVFLKNCDDQNINLTDKTRWTVCGGLATKDAARSNIGYLAFAGTSNSCYAIGLVLNSSLTVSGTAQNNYLRYCTVKGATSLSCAGYICIELSSLESSVSVNNASTRLDLLNSQMEDAAVLKIIDGNAVITSCRNVSLNVSGGIVQILGSTNLAPATGGTYSIISTGGTVIVGDAVSVKADGTLAPVSLVGVAYNLGKMLFDLENSYLGGIELDAVLTARQIKTKLKDNDGSTDLPPVGYSRLDSIIQYFRDNLKALFSYFTNGKANDAAQADKLTTARTISLSGDATGSVSFDGSADADIPVILNSLGLVKNGVVRISGNGGDYASTVGPYQARRYFKLADIQYQTQGWDSKLLFDIFYTQASNGAGSGEVSDKVVLQLEFADNTFNIIQRTNGVNGNGIVIIHDSARQIFEVYGCASPGVVDSNRLYIDVRNMFFYIVNNDDNNAPAINFFANQGSYSNNTGLTQIEFNALPKTSMKWLWDNLFNELLPSQVQVGDNVSAFDFLAEPDPTVIITSVYTMFSMNSNALRLAEVSQDWLEGNGNLAAGALGVFDYSGTFTPIWTYNNGWQDSFEFEYLNDGNSHTVRWNTDIKRIGLTVPEPVTSNNTGDGYDDGLFIVEMA